MRLIHACAKHARKESHNRCHADIYGKIGTIQANRTSQQEIKHTKSGYMEVHKMTFGSTKKDTACAVCGRHLVRQRRNTGLLHCCTACCNMLALIDRRSKRIFGV